MQRKTSLTRIGVVRPGSLDVDPEWTIVYQVQWADQRHILPVRVPGPDERDATIQGWRAMAKHLTDLTRQAAREADAAEAKLPKRQRLSKPLRVRFV